MMPKDSGITPPPIPWMTRATIMTVTSVVTPARAATSSRSLPTVSPLRPMIGVKIDADSR